MDNRFLNFITSTQVVKTMFTKGLITASEYAQAMGYLEAKYCIKISDNYLPNQLTCTPIKWIYSNVKKEDICDAKDNED